MQKGRQKEAKTAENPTSIFEVKVSHGSSLAQIENTLQIIKHGGEGHNWYWSYDVNFAVTKNFDIVVHHDGWHEQLRKDHGIEERDLIAEGKAYAMLEKRQICIIPRFKSTGMVEIFHFASKKCFNANEIVGEDRARYEKAVKERREATDQVERLLVDFLRPLVKLSDSK